MDNMEYSKKVFTLPRNQTLLRSHLTHGLVNTLTEISRLPFTRKASNKTVPPTVIMSLGMSRFYGTCFKRK